MKQGSRSVTCGERQSASQVLHQYSNVGEVWVTLSNFGFSFEFIWDWIPTAEQLQWKEDEKENLWLQVVPNVYSREFGAIGMMVVGSGILEVSDA